MEAEHEALEAARVEAKVCQAGCAGCGELFGFSRKTGKGKKEGAELDYGVQFCEAVSNTDIKAGVNNAAVNPGGCAESIERR